VCRFGDLARAVLGCGERQKLSALVLAKGHEALVVHARARVCAAHGKQVGFQRMVLDRVKDLFAPGGKNKTKTKTKTKTKNIYF